MAYMTDQTNFRRAGIVEAIKANPLPAALVGVGVGWLLFKNARTGTTMGEYTHTYPERYYDTPGKDEPFSAGEGRFFSKAQATLSENASKVQDAVENAAASAQKQVTDMTSTVQHKAGEVASKASEVASNLQTKATELSSNVHGKVREQTDYLSQQARYQAERASQGFQDTLEQNPLALGAAAIAVGAMVGLMLPRTRPENQLMGGARDHLMGQAQNAAKDTIKKVEQVATQAYRSAEETAKSELQNQETPLAF